jgi:hypothetical protein
MPLMPMVHVSIDRCHYTTLHPVVADASTYCHATGKSDPYVILSIESAKVKTAVKPATLTPQWDETHSLNFSNLTSVGVYSQRIGGGCC